MAVRPAQLCDREGPHRPRPVFAADRGRRRAVGFRGGAAARAGDAPGHRDQRWARDPRAGRGSDAADRGAPAHQPIRVGGLLFPARLGGVYRSHCARTARGSEGDAGAGQFPRPRVTPVQDAARKPAAFARDHGDAPAVVRASAHAHRPHAVGSRAHGSHGHADSRKRAPRARAGGPATRAARARRGCRARGRAIRRARRQGSDQDLRGYRSRPVRAHRSARPRCGRAQSARERDSRRHARRRRQHHIRRPTDRWRGRAIGP